jgi:3-hydroxyacyl-CoA dehydrogenase
LQLRAEDFEHRAEELLAVADAVVATKFGMRYATGTQYYVDTGAIAGFRAAALSFLANAFGTQHPFYSEFDQRVVKNGLSAANAGREILTAAAAEVRGGWSQRVRSLVASELFSDFLEMAEYLLREGYKDAAAVIIGSTLEEHLRTLCRNRAMEVERDRNGRILAKRADALNSDLAAAGVYSKLDQKSVATWLDLRNRAAHGKYDEYSRQQVDLLHQGVVEFMSRVPQ